MSAKDIKEKGWENVQIKVKKKDYILFIYLLKKIRHLLLG